MVCAQQATGSGGGFAPGAREIFSLNLAQEPLGDFAKPMGELVSPLSGKLEVVEKEGQKMLRSSMESEFLIALPERLPERFTLEFDLITRASGYNSYELSFEGTPTPNRGPASAYVTWRQGGVTLFGGRDAPTNLNPMPDDVQAEIEGQLAEVRVEVAGDNFTMYTNGRMIFNAPAVKFPRAKVLRVGLNGVDGKQYAVHLSRLRIADAATTMPATAQTQSAALAGSRTAGGSTGSGTNSNSGPGAAITITNVKVSVNTNGLATVTWDTLPMAATYFVVRWNANDPACCNAMSPPGFPLTTTVWQDGVLPLGGTYVYRVIGKTANGTYEGEGRFRYTGTSVTPNIATNSADTSTDKTVFRLPGSSDLPTLADPPPPPSSPTPIGDLPTAPFSSGPRTVSVYPAPTSPPAPRTGPTTLDLVGATGPGTIVGTQPAPTSPTIQPPPNSTTYVPPPPGTITNTPTPYVPPPPVAGVPNPSAAPDTTSGPSSTVSSGPGMPASGRFQVMLTGVKVTTPTADDLLSLDGRGDEIFGAAAVLVWDRKLNTNKSYALLQTQDYGEVGLALALPNRIQAGSISTKGGLVAGDRAPYYYDPSGSQIPDPVADRFPLLVWEGELQPGGDMVIVAPSVWERDAVHVHWESYKINWKSVSPAAVLASPSIQLQMGEQAVSLTQIPLNPLVLAAPPTPTFNGQPINGYKIADLAFGPSNDRPIGMKATLGVFIYEERMTVITYEKVATMKSGEAVTMAIPLKEPPGLALNGDYTLYLRVKRVQ